MQAIKARVTKGLSHYSVIPTCDNSGAKLVKIVSVFRNKPVKGRHPETGVGDLVMVAVKKGTTEMRKKVVFAIIVRQKKDNAMCVLRTQMEK